jgi:hypothetical protein
MAAGRVFLSFPAVSPAARNADRPAAYAICRRVDEAKIFPAFIPEESPDQPGVAAASPAQTRFPLRLADRFFSGLGFVACFPAWITVAFAGLPPKSRTADFRRYPASRANPPGKAGFSFMFNPIRMPSFEHPCFNYA